MPAINPLLIHVGRGELYIGVTIPATPPVALTNGQPADGRYLGSTLDQCNMIYRPTTFDIRTQQSTTVVGYVITEEELRIEFGIGELTYENLRDTVMGARDNSGFITLGGNIVPATQSALIVAPRRAGGYIEAMVYLGVFAEDRTFGFLRQSWMNPRVVIRAQGILTRVQGDQLGFFHPNVSSA
jgi:hypothetical protein